MRAEDFERIYAEHAPGVLAFLAYRSGDRALAEDLAAEAFERVYRTRFRFDPRRASAKTWVYSIALNCLRDHARRERAERSALERAADDPARDAGQALDQVDDRETLRRAMRVLSEEEREVVGLRVVADLTLPELARVLGTSRTTAEGRLYGGLRKLRRELGSERADGLALKDR
jgi:RNA polymerase sigma factor (sigma-70 family)